MIHLKSSDKKILSMTLLPIKMKEWTLVELNSQLKKLYSNKDLLKKILSKNLQIINPGEGVEKREPSCTVGGNVNWYCHYGEQYGDSLKNEK